MTASPSPKTCPRCRNPIPSDAPGNLCPGCLLLEAAMPGDTLGGALGSAPSVEEVSAAFPDLEIMELVGHGGMGVVFKARQIRLGRLIALKILPPALAREPGFSERFTREARALARLNHPHIVAVYDFGESAGFCYLLMEYVTGVNLRQAMRAGVKPEQALTLVPQICEALQFAHDHGVLHRDIKPENILLDTTGKPKLADFGIAKLAGDHESATGLTLSGASLGTAAYMAPEQIEKPGTVDHRADIYSLGVVLYEMLTGELPLGRFAAPSEKSGVALGVDEVVLRALEKERERRQQTASQMKSEVEYANTAAGAAGRAGDDEWMLRCPACGRARRLSEAGGIRIGAASMGKRIAGTCSHCGFHGMIDVITLRDLRAKPFTPDPVAARRRAADAGKWPVWKVALLGTIFGIPVAVMATMLAVPAFQASGHAAAGGILVGLAVLGSIWLLFVTTLAGFRRLVREGVPNWAAFLLMAMVGFVFTAVIFPSATYQLSRAKSPRRIDAWDRNSRPAPQPMLPGEAPKTPEDARHAALLDEAVQLAQEKYDMARANHEAKVISTQSLEEAALDLAIAQARGDAVKILEAKVSHAEKAVERAQAQLEAKTVSPATIRDLRSELNRLQLNLDQARTTARAKPAAPRSQPGVAPVNSPPPGADVPKPAPGLTPPPTVSVVSATDAAPPTRTAMGAGNAPVISAAGATTPPALPPGYPPSTGGMTYPPLPPGYTPRASSGEIAPPTIPPADRPGAAAPPNASATPRAELDQASQVAVAKALLEKQRQLYAEGLGSVSALWETERHLIEIRESNPFQKLTALLQAAQADLAVAKLRETAGQATKSDAVMLESEINRLQRQLQKLPPLGLPGAGSPTPAVWPARPPELPNPVPPARKATPTPTPSNELPPPITNPDAAQRALPAPSVAPIVPPAFPTQPAIGNTPVPVRVDPNRAENPNNHQPPQDVATNGNGTTRNAPPANGTDENQTKARALQDEAIQLAEQQLQIVEARFANGLATPEDRLKAQRDVAVAAARGDELAALKAEITLAEAELQFDRARKDAGLATNEQVTQTQLRLNGFQQKLSALTAPKAAGRKKSANDLVAEKELAEERRKLDAVPARSPTPLLQRPANTPPASPPNAVPSNSTPPKIDGGGPALDVPSAGSPAAKPNISPAPLTTPPRQTTLQDEAIRMAQEKLQNVQIRIDSGLATYKDRVMPLRDLAIAKAGRNELQAIEAEIAYSQALLTFLRIQLRAGVIRQDEVREAESRLESSWQKLATLIPAKEAEQKKLASELVVESLESAKRKLTTAEAQNPRSEPAILDAQIELREASLEFSKQLRAGGQVSAEEIAKEEKALAKLRDERDALRKTPAVSK